MNDILTKLAAPFSPEAISWRIGAMNQDKTKAMALAYIDARDVQDRLNEVCGALWQVRHPWSNGSLIACEIGILIDNEGWLWRGDGAGEGEVDDALSGPRKEQQLDMARKAAFSDSFKRAAVRWGVGRYLYDVASPWVEIEARGRSYFIPDREIARLRQFLAGKRVEAPTQVTQQQPQSNRDVLAAAYQRIRHAIEIAEKTSLVDEIVRVNADDLRKIKEHSGNAYTTLMELARNRRNELSGMTTESEIVA